VDKTIFCDDSIFGDPTLSPEWSSAYTFSGENKYCLCLLGEGQSWTKCAEQGRNCSCPGGIVRYVFATPTSRTSTPTTTTPAPVTTKNFSWGNVANLWHKRHLALTNLLRKLTRGRRAIHEISVISKSIWDCTFCPPGSQANAECVDGKTNVNTTTVTTNEIVERNCAAIKNPKNDCKKMDDKLQCCICGGGVRNYYPKAQASCTT
jgi:hypothetical protein